MAQLQGERPGRVEIIHRFKAELQADAKVFAGSAAVIDIAPGAGKGYYKAAVAAEDLVARGRFTETVDNTGGANGAKKAEIELLKPIYVIRWDNSTTTPCAKSDRGSPGYYESDHEVTPDAAPGGISVSEAGRIFDIAGNKVLVEVM
jgi:hypothetical protein